ncbi:MAG TPA: transglycosylase SLT domain-containing protein [Chloroflexota bacterium]|nr:transglycosylase SLT domain-containing protein [Chloroflexota bacterium]
MPWRLRRAIVVLALGSTIAQGCAPAAFLTSTAGLATEVSARAPGLLSEVPSPRLDPLVMRVLPQLVPVDLTDLTTARRLRRNGETEAAQRAFTTLLEREPSVAAAARLELAVLALDEGQLDTAAAHLEALLRDYPDQPERVPATYLLAGVERRRGNLQAAIARLEEYLRLSDTLAAYARLQLAELYAALGAPERGWEEAARAAALPGSRRLRIEALEWMARTAAERGDRETARARWEEIWPLAATPAYRAEVLWQLASLARDQGDLAAAAERYRTIVVDYPSTSRAADALRVLNELGWADLISYYQAGLVRFYQGQYDRALGAFEAQLALGGSEDELAGATYYRAVVLLRQGEESAARAGFAAVAASFPASELAPVALFRVARLLEDAARYEEAAATYATLTERYPETAAGQIAQFRRGFALYCAGRYDAALAAWVAALPQAVARTVRSAALGQAENPRAAILFWMGKVLALQGRQDEARARWAEAGAAGPDAFYGLRAKALLAGDGDAPLAGLDAGRLSPPPPDEELTAWVAGYGAEAAALAAELTADPAWRRGAALWAIGRRSEATWEFDDLRDRFAADPPRLYALGVALRDLGADHLALRAAQQLWAASGAASVYELPRAVRALLYPTPYAELVLAAAARWGLDPLLFFALIRQESAFDPRAESSARARGLTQVIPSTARDIARALGWGAIADTDLFKPVVSIEFGAYYFARALRRFQGNLYPALAGYNAGPGTAAAWLNQPGASDPDLYAEQIPYAETYTYVRRIYENYRLYRELYGGA